MWRMVKDVLVRNRNLIRRAVLTLGVTLFAAGLAACAGQAASDHASIVVSSPAALADQAIAIKVTGLAAGQRVTVTAQATDSDRISWRAGAAFTADANGVVNWPPRLPRRAATSTRTR
jgi:Acyl-CoA thioester hydrolase/BAAT N-terminal region